MNVCNSCRTIAPVGRPQDQALADRVVDMEKLQIPAELAVIAQFRLFELCEVGVELGLRRERGAVDPLKLDVVLVPAVIRAGDVEQLERAGGGGGLHVRAGAQVDELAVLIERDCLAFGNVGKAADFVAFLPAALDQRDGLVARDFAAGEHLAFRGDLAHLLLDAREILGREFMLQVDVVVEARVGRRPDVEFRVGEDAEQRRGQHVRTRMTEFLQRCHGHGGSEGLRRRVTALSKAVMKDLRALLANPQVFPVELTLSSGDKIKISHPDFVHYSEKMNRVFFYPEDEHGVFEMIIPTQIAKIRAKVKKRAA